MARHVFAINRNGIDALCYLQLDSPIARLQLNADHEKLPHPANRLCADGVQQGLRLCVDISFRDFSAYFLTEMQPLSKFRHRLPRG